ncbi:MAG TPA: hypothetical protein VN862_00715 [Candidatus Acidoferrales bacterium]|nr:hypothetical protein [Candidatus Acidoferrales bacterium]
MLAIFGVAQRLPGQSNGPQAAPAPDVAQQAGGQGGGRRGGGAGGPGGEGRGGGQYGALHMRLIGPSMISGRIQSIAVDLTNKRHYFIGVASGGVWRTTDGGVTFTPVFDDQGSYSIGYVAIDPKNSSVVWVGTGENNSQRSVSYGDGVYRSDDDGHTWKNMGLQHSEHIARVLIDPRNSDVVYVAAQGPLWGSGGDRGLFKTTDGGKTWKNVLSIGEWTGVSDAAFAPDNPDTIYATAYQRERRQWTLIDGGPESAFYKSTDAGATWHKLTAGLPTGDLGRIGIAVTPADPKLVYAVVEAENRQGGIFVSSDRGETWEKRNDFFSSAPMYYGTIFADPKNAERIYVMDTLIMTSVDGGHTLTPWNTRSKHVDNHVVWIDPDDTEHVMVGCDGGLYESYSRGETWDYKANLPLGQFYDVVADSDAPFYHVYGGTQDNSSVGGPARTRSGSGIINSDWFNTQGGDGFHSAVDPEDPNTVYAELQEGNLVRFDRRTGERVNIIPTAAPGEPPVRWDWDAPILVSPHSHTRLYFASDRLYRSDDRGDSWKPISGDLTRHVDRNSLPIMGKVWPPEAVAKNTSTAQFGNATAISESPKKEGMIYVGTDDGLINVTEDGGAHWRKLDTFPDVPEMTYVSRIFASQHDVNTVYASFDGHQNEDFKPHILKSTDAGKSWTSISGDLPENGPVMAIAEDPVDSNLVFIGTEFGLYFTTNGGAHWTRLRNGLPTIAVRDLAIQKQMGDLVIATFGRSIYVLDDYTPLRTAEQASTKSAAIFPVRDSWLYIASTPFGGTGKADQGDSFFTGENPPMGALITYEVKQAPQTKRAKRLAEERDAQRNGAKISYPTLEELRAEEEEAAPQLIFTISDSAGHPVRRLTAPAGPGMRRITWDMHSAAASIPLGNAQGGRGGGGGFFGGGAAEGPLVIPGKYKVSMELEADGKTSELAGAVEFNVVADGVRPISPEDHAALMAFAQKTAKLQAALSAAVDVANNAQTELADIKRALAAMPSADPALLKTADDLEHRDAEIILALSGDRIARQYQEETSPSIQQRIGKVSGGLFDATTKPTGTQINDYKVAGELFVPVQAKLRELVEVDLAKFEKQLDAAGVPHTPGRVPNWKDQ